MVNAGTVVDWGSLGSEFWSAVPVGLTGVTAVATANNHVVALKTDGTVVAWGSNQFGQATVPAGLSGVTGVAAGQTHSLAVKSDGTVVAWGQNFYGDTTPPPRLRGVRVVQVAAGAYTSLVLKGDGTVDGFGWNRDGEAKPPAGLTGVVAISASWIHSMALRGDGTVVEWGIDYAPIPVGLDHVVAISSGPHNDMALRSDGSVVEWALGQAQPQMHVGPYTAISAAAELAVRPDGTVDSWGTLGPAPTWLHNVTAVASDTMTGRYAVAIGSGSMAVTSVAPRSVGQNSEQTVWLRGAGFSGGTTVLRFSSPDITTDQPIVYSPSLLSVKVTVGPGATVGPGDIEVTNQDGNTGTCLSCLTVNPGPVITAVHGPVVPGATDARVWVTGGNFRVGVHAVTDLSGVTIVSTRRIDSSHLTITLDVADSAPQGSGALTIVNPDGGTATKSLTVT